MGRRSAAFLAAAFLAAAAAEAGEVRGPVLGNNGWRGEVRDEGAPDVDRVDAKGPPAQEAIGEPAGRRSHVEGDGPRHGHAEVVEGPGELFAAPRDEGARRRRENDFLAGTDRRAALRRGDAREEDAARQDQPLGLRARLRQAAGHHLGVKPGATQAGGAKSVRMAAAFSRIRQSFRAGT